MPRSLWCAAFLAVLSATTPAQAPSCLPYVNTDGWNELTDATPLGGGQGPEDIAYNPLTNTLFVSHDFPNASPDILLEYTLDGILVGTSVMLPGAGGLCAMANGNLLVTNGGNIIEVAPNGIAVPGGINLVTNYGNIQDLEFDASGNLWIHNGNTGDFSTINTTTGAITPRFILMTSPGSPVPPAVTGSQGFTFAPNGNILAAAAFFQNGGNSNGTLFEVTPTGTVVCQGFGAGFLRLRRDNDPCITTPASFTIINGMTWIAPLNELAISNFFVVGGANIARFAPPGTAFAARIGTDALRTDNLRFRISFTGNPVIGQAGFSLTITNIYAGDTLYWGASLARLCTDPVVGSGNLYIDLGPGLFFLIPIGVSTSVFTIPVDLTGVPPSAAGAELFTQFGALDFGSPALPALLSAALRIRLDVQP